MKTQFEKMMLSIKTDKLLTEIYEEIDKQDSLGNNSVLFELTGSDAEELSDAVLVNLQSNPNIAFAEAYCANDGLFISVAWKGE